MSNKIIDVVNNRTIEFASPLVRDLAKSVSAAFQIDANKNKKIEPMEWLAFGQVLVVSGFRHYSSAPEAWKDILDANSPERKELIEVFATSFDIENDKLEVLIEDSFRFIERAGTEGYALALRWRDIGRKTEEPNT